MASQGPLFPGTTASLANAGTSENAEAWVSPGNVVSDNGVEASITAATFDTPDISQLLVASNFGFTLPSGAVPTGIIVEIERRDQAIGAASDNRVQLAKGTTFASLVGTNKADTALDWPTAVAIKTYGTSTDLWGTTWTRAEINASSFAVMLSVQADAANTDIFVDFIRITVHYQYEKAGIVEAGARAAGADALTASEAGTVSSAVQAAGGDSWEAVEAGRVQSQALASGVSLKESSGYQKAGSVTPTARTAGADVFEATETGALVTAARAAGADVREAVEAGSVTTAALAAGADVRDAVEAGTLASAARAAGADVREASETGTLAASARAAGTDAEERGEAGAVWAGVLAAGTDTEERGEAGTLAAGALAAGTSQKVSGGEHVKAGALVAGTRAGGPRTVTWNRVGAVLASPIGAGVAQAQTSTRLVTGGFDTPSGSPRVTSGPLDGSFGTTRQGGTFTSDPGPAV
jgi:hypothetical protein